MCNRVPPLLLHARMSLVSKPAKLYRGPVDVAVPMTAAGFEPSVFLYLVNEPRTHNRRWYRHRLFGQHLL